MAQELLRIIRENNISELGQVLQRMNSVDIAKSMEELEGKYLLLVFRLLTPLIESIFSFISFKVEPTKGRRYSLGVQILSILTKVV